MNPWVNYSHLFYFKTIAEEGSISKAAQKLRLGQPTLSAQLKILEDQLGVLLFIRNHKKITLSEQGKIVLSYAQQIFRTGNEMIEVLNDRKTPSRIHLHIGAIDSISKQVILSLTKAAFKIGPCHISLTEGNSDEIVRELVGHRVDLFVCNFLPPVRGLIHRQISKDPIKVYGSPKFRNLKKNFPHSLSKQPFVFPTFDSRIRYDLDHWFQSHEITPDIIAETQDIAVRKLIAIDGLGLIPTGHQNVQRQVKLGELVEIGPLSGISESIYLISGDRTLPNPIARELMKTFHL